MRTPTLTNDEKKAAEAAFQKQPFNPMWSEAARKVYDGLSAVLRKTQLAPDENVVERDEQKGTHCSGHPLLWRVPVAGPEQRVPNGYPAMGWEVECGRTGERP